VQLVGTTMEGQSPRRQPAREPRRLNSTTRPGEFVVTVEEQEGGAAAAGGEGGDAAAAGEEL
jgi:hypothetical protein